MITVRPARNDGRVALFEIDPSHPHGEVFLWGAPECPATEVGETAAVMEGIGRGDLVRVYEPPAPPAAPAAPAAPPAAPPDGNRDKSGKG